MKILGVVLRGIPLSDAGNSCGYLNGSSERSWSMIIHQFALQKQPLEVFCEIMCSQKFCKFSLKTQVFEFHFNKDKKFNGKETSVQIFSCKICKIFKSIHFEECLWTTSSGPNSMVNRDVFRTLEIYKTQTIFTQKVQINV